MANQPLNIDLSGKIILVTGATGGIGKEIARGLARLKATVIIGARNPQKGEATRAEIARETGNNNVSVMTLDVASLASIRAFADAFNAKYDRLDVLVNNAGAWFTDRRESVDGHELTFATNVLGAHAVTTALLDRLRAAPSARVINIVSGLASSYHANDLEYARRKWDGFKAYSQSKQALRMLTWGLAKRLEGSRVTANAVAPGFVKTDFNQSAHGFVPMMINLSLKLFGISAADGADTAVWAAASPEMETVSNKFFENRQEKEGNFRDAAAISDLEERLDAIISKPAVTLRAE